MQRPLQIEDNGSKRLIGYLIQCPTVYAEFWLIWARQILIDNLFSEPLVPCCFEEEKEHEPEDKISVRSSEIHSDFVISDPFNSVITLSNRNAVVE